MFLQNKQLREIKNHDRLNIMESKNQEFSDKKGVWIEMIQLDKVGSKKYNENLRSSWNNK